MRQHKQHRVFLFYFCLFVFALQGCLNNQDQEMDVQCDLLIYCGVTMVKAVREIADIFEQEHNCIITIEQGGSEELYQSLKKNKKGDLYLAGSAGYRSQYIHEGILDEYISVGHNQIAFIVAKGNPEQITPDIGNLAKREYRVAIGHPDIGSVGRHTKTILSKIGIYDQVLRNVVSIVPDSRLMIKLLKEKKVDLILNWRATAYFDENAPFVDAIELGQSIAPKKELLFNMLTFSKNKKLTRAFLRFAESDEGQQIFSKYKFIDKKDKSTTADSPVNAGLSL